MNCRNELILLDAILKIRLILPTVSRRGQSRDRPTRRLVSRDGPFRALTDQEKSNPTIAVVVIPYPGVIHMSSAAKEMEDQALEPSVLHAQ